MKCTCCSAIVTLLLVTTACAPPPSDDPEMILTGGVIYALGDSDAPVTSLAIRGDTIMAIGSLDDVSPLAGDYTQQMRLDGAVVLPGAYDAWVDLEALGRWSTSTLDMRRASSLEEAQAMVRNAAGDGAGDDQWLVGWGWDENDWPAPVLPTASDIDALGVTRPVVLIHRNGAVAWLNATARAALPARPSEGVVGGPHMAPLRRLIVGAPEQRAAWIAEGSRIAASSGVTRIGTAPTDVAAVEALLELEFRGLLPLRVDVRLTAEAADQFATTESPDRLATSRLVRVTAVGVALDGPISSRLAALDDDYAVEAPPTPTYGEALGAAAETAARAALPLHIQASGDAAVADALAAIDASAPGGMLIGADLLGPDVTVPAGTTVAMAAARFSRDVYWLDRVLGPPRTDRAHAWADLSAGGATLRFSSDAPAGYLRPLTAMATAISRQDPEGYPADGWNLSQALAAPLLLRALTADGQLRAGGPADLVVWSEDPMSGDPAALRRAEAMLTMVDGRVAFSRALVDPNAPESGR